ncbi:hypothetical protein QYE76_012840 [Lolium multiflorum]|uniref:CCHC-type domain-containing protein n=1 Tax=Lolium multiflorum TaxID=4521 RepID=A0AAD8U1B6_LOLMU|nr:hypothetical protein QYE76_012840 [Lolium multiflorum]
MGSHVLLSDSDLSADSVTSRAQAPPLRSLVVAPPGHQLGSWGWDAGAGPSRPPAAAQAAPSPAPGWQTMRPRRHRNATRAPAASHPRREFRPLPASRPPGGPASRIPASLHGRCYNCGDEGHISAQCSNATRCMRCGGTEHISRDCKRPRSPSAEAQLRLDAPPLRRPSGGAAAVMVRASPPRPPSRFSGSGGPGTALPPPPPRQPSSAAEGRIWRDVVISSSSAGPGSSGPVSFSALFAPPSPSSSPATATTEALPGHPPPYRLDLCYMLPSQGMLLMEGDLDGAVIVTVVGARMAVSPDVAAAELHACLNLTPLDFSIRSFEPADFLLLCASLEVRDLLVHAESVANPQFSLHLELWSRQVGATLREAPLLADLEIRGIPTHAWAERTATKLLEGAGVIDEVAPETASRSDMSCFRLSLWTHDVAAIPAVRWLAVPEPGSGLRLQVADGRRRPRSESPRMLWYRVRFWVVRWLIGGPPGSGSDSAHDTTRGGGSGAPGAPGPRDGHDRDGGAPPPRRRRRRRAPRRRRGRSDPADAVVQPGQRAAVLPPPVDAPADGRWVPAASSRATPAPSPAHVALATCMVVDPLHGSHEPVRAAANARVPDGQLAEQCAGDAWSATDRGMQSPSPALRGTRLVSGGSAERSTGQLAFSAPSVSHDEVGGSADGDTADASASFLAGNNFALQAAESFLASRREAARSQRGSPEGPASCARPASFVSGSFGCVLSVAAGSQGGAVPHAGLDSPHAGLDSPHVGLLPQSSPSAQLIDGGADGSSAAGASSSDVAALVGLLQQFRRHLDDPLLPLPDPKVVRRRLFRSGKGSVRRSRRLAAKSKGVSTPAIKKARKLLGVCHEGERLSAEQLDDYAAIFASPLGPEQVAALASLFGIHCSAVDETALGDAGAPLA